MAVNNLIILAPGVAQVTHSYSRRLPALGLKSGFSPVPSFARGNKKYDNFLA